jgi:phosphoglycolate phosphatase-like HAD superfamily hydrolase
VTRKSLKVLAFLLIFLSTSLAAQAGDPLASWRDGAAKQAIIGFVSKVTKKGGPDYVSPAQRIAVFDNDGTLWAENPIYFQLAYALDRVKQLAPQHPGWKTQEPFASVLSGDAKRLAKLGHKEIFQLVAATHAGMTTEEFAAQVEAWLGTARHPQKKRPYTSMVYQPMLELLSYLRSRGFKNFIVSGGGVEFMRVFAEKVYGIPPEQVIGSSLKSKWEIKGGKPVIVKLPEISNIDDKEGKPLNINLHIGRRPILAAGNSDGDLAMLQWTDAGPGPKLMLLVHHDDAKREWAYDRKSSVGRLDKALDIAQKRGWTVISMRADFGRVFPVEK